MKFRFSGIKLTMKKLLFILNPKTAKTMVSPYLIDIIDIFIKSGYDVDVHVTQNKDDTAYIARTRGEAYDTVVCAGGDGTLNKTVSGILSLSRRPRIGYIPAGTTNDFAVSWGIPQKPLDAARSITNTKPLLTDVSIFCGRPFVYVAAFGAFTEVSYQTPQLLKNSLGRTAYFFEGLKSLGTIRSWKMKIEHDHGTVEGEFLYGMISNTRRVGGFDLKIKKNISLSDGLMEVLLVRSPETPADRAKMLGAVLAQDVTSEYITFAHTTHIRFESDEPIPWTVDGEKGGMVERGEAAILKHAIELYF